MHSFSNCSQMLLYLKLLLCLFFFFQAEDGIRDLTVTGVQTCALPICEGSPEKAGRVFLPGSLQQVSGNPRPCWVYRSAASLAQRHHRHELLELLPQCA